MSGLPEGDLTLPVACPYQARYNAAAGQALCAAVDRLASRGVVNDRVLDIATSSSLDVALALSHPEAPPERLEVAALWYVFLVYADDHWDAERSTSGPRWASQLYEEHEDLRNVLRSGFSASGRTSAYLLDETLQRIAAVDSAFDDSGFRQAIEDYLAAVQWELHQRAADRIPDLVTYLRMRRVFSTAAVQPELSSFVSRRSLPPRARANPLIQLLDAAAADYGCLVNDYYSYLRETGIERSTSNVISVLQAHEYLDTAQAVRRTEQLIERSTQTFAETRDIIHLCMRDIDPDQLNGYARSHEDFMSAAARWPAIAQRYEAPPLRQVEPRAPRPPLCLDERSSTHAQ